MTYKIGSRWGSIDLRPLFKLYNIAFAGEAGDNIANIVPGDLVAIANGFDIVGIGTVQGIINLNSIDLTLFNKWNPEQKGKYYEVLYTKDEDEDEVRRDLNTILFSKIYWSENSFFNYQNMSQFSQVHGDHASRIIKLFDKLSKMNNLLTTLESNKNMVLTGAPGTGKTFLAKEIALKLIFGKDKEDLLSEVEKEKLKTQLALVQFHPSYDYTDFVEGLRPYKEEGKEVGFKLKNGVFKSFCSKALKAYKDDINKDDFGKRKFIFIIDEINRGELSKIFGELFYSIDPGYRGSVGSVKTQYHNINEAEDFVDSETESFYIPENVYIVGTMNDIDRSVESIDFAMRRRFAWIEIKPEDRKSMWDGQIDEFKVSAALKMEALNNIIKENTNLGSHYQIGPAYFLKLKEYDGDSQNRFNNLWQNHLEILLKEYLRGLPDAATTFENLKNAYNGINQNNGQ